jgi:hypothetical protein
VKKRRRKNIPGYSTDNNINLYSLEKNLAIFEAEKYGNFSRQILFDLQIHKSCFYSAIEACNSTDKFHHMSIR